MSNSIGLQESEILELLASRYRDSYYDLYPGFSKVKKLDIEYAFETKKSAYREVNEVLNLFDGMPKEVTLYRTIQCKDENDVDLVAPGLCWSFNEKSAVRFSQDNLGKNTFLISCKTAKNNINWVVTIRQYLEYSGVGIADSEDEIRVGNESMLVDVKVLKKIK